MEVFWRLRDDFNYTLNRAGAVLDPDDVGMLGERHNSGVSSVMPVKIGTE
jgi:hypothetical protein